MIGLLERLYDFYSSALGGKWLHPLHLGIALTRKVLC